MKKQIHFVSVETLIPVESSENGPYGVITPEHAKSLAMGMIAEQAQRKTLQLSVETEDAE